MTRGNRSFSRARTSSFRFPPRRSWETGVGSCRPPRHFSVSRFFTLQDATFLEGAPFLVVLCKRTLTGQLTFSVHFRFPFGNGYLPTLIVHLWQLNLVAASESLPASRASEPSLPLRLGEIVENCFRPACFFYSIRRGYHLLGNDVFGFVSGVIALLGTVLDFVTTYLYFFNNASVVKQSKIS